MLVMAVLACKPEVAEKYALCRTVGRHASWSSPAMPNAPGSWRYGGASDSWLLRAAACEVTSHASRHADAEREFMSGDLPRLSARHVGKVDAESRSLGLRLRYREAPLR